MEELFWEGANMVLLRTPGGRDTITLNDDPRQNLAWAGDGGGIAHFGFLMDKGDLDRAVEEGVAAGGSLLRRVIGMSGAAGADLHVPS